MPEVLDAIRENGLALVALVLVSGALVVVARTLYKELTDRRVRAEELTDEAIATFDTATKVTERALASLEGALEELRRKP